MSVCIKCGYKNQEGVTFCGKCGNKMASPGSVETENAASSMVTVKIHGYTQWFAVCPDIKVEHNGQLVATVARNEEKVITIPAGGNLEFKCSSKRACIRVGNQDFDAWITWNRVTGNLEILSDSDKQKQEPNIKGTGNSNSNDTYRLVEFKKSLGSKEMVSGIIWVCIGIGQFILGVVFGYWVTLIVAVWNIIMGISGIRLKEQIMNMSGIEIFKRYEDQASSSIINLLANLSLGWVFGAIGSVFDLVIRKYVRQNKDLLVSDTTN